MSAPSAPAIATARDDLFPIARAFATARRVALDVESDGMFAYRARVCTVQLAARGDVVVVDAMGLALDPLAELLGESGPIKIVHDVAFDARVLAERGVVIGNVHDTAIAARMLARPATGLASLAMTELGVTLDKTLQHHDWRERPLRPEHLDYLARDVAHLDALDDKLWGEVEARSIADEVLEETRYRIACAVAAAREDQDAERAIAYGSAKGFDKLGTIEAATFRRLWHAREAEAVRLDVPPARLIPGELMLAIARRRPRALRELISMRLPTRAEAIAPSLLEAIAAGVTDGAIPESERAQLETPRIPREVIARRRARERALSAWRKAEAKAREVDEQVVLPGHCLRELADSEALQTEEVARTAGFGACRARYVEPIASALQSAETTA